MDLSKSIFKIKQTGIKLETGKILISSPFLEDGLFGRSIILITDISAADDGAIGLVLNKPTEILLSDVSIDFPFKDINLYTGGPVQTDSMFILHTYGDIIEGSVHIIDNIYWGGNKAQIEEYIKLGRIDIQKIKFFLGYSGWAYQQLKDELKTESWIISDFNNSIDILNYKSKDDLWKNYVSSFGNKYEFWLKLPSKASDN